MKVDLRYRAYCAYLATYITSIVWLIGFFVFLFTLPANNCIMDETEALVILTGGKNRINEGFTIFAQNQNNVKQLLISGVSKNLNPKYFSSLANRHSIDNSKITLGRLATTTVENAIETNIFTQSRGYKNICIITSDYHMPRSRMIFRDTMPNINIGSISVIPHDYGLYLNTSRLGIAFIEYNKFILKFINLTYINNMKIVDAFLYKHLLAIIDLYKSIRDKFQVLS